MVGAGELCIFGFSYLCKWTLENHIELFVKYELCWDSLQDYRNESQDFALKLDFFSLHYFSKFVCSSEQVYAVESW